MCVIDSANTEWTSPILFVQKKGGTQIFYIYYVNLNAMTIWDSYPIQVMDWCADSLGYA